MSKCLIRFCNSLAGVIRGMTFATLCLTSISMAATSPEIFREEMISHRARVKMMALMLFDEYYLGRVHLTRELVADYLSLHDKPKIEDIDTLRARPGGYNALIPIFKRFAPFYGKSPAQMTHAQRSSLAAVGRDLNRLESEEKEIFFAKHQLSHKEIRILKYIEVIADITDNGRNRSHEFGHEYVEFGGAERFDDFDQGEAAERSQWVETKFKAAVIAFRNSQAKTCSLSIHVPAAAR